MGKALLGTSFTILEKIAIVACVTVLVSCPTKQVLKFSAPRHIPLLQQSSVLQRNTLKLLHIREIRLIDV